MVGLENILEHRNIFLIKMQMHFPAVMSGDGGRSNLLGMNSRFYKLQMDSFEDE